MVLLLLLLLFALATADATAEAVQDIVDEVVLVVACGAVIDSEVDAGGLEFGDGAESGGDDDGDSSSPSAAFLRKVRGDVEIETVDEGERLPLSVIAIGTLVSFISRSIRFA